MVSCEYLSVKFKRMSIISTFAVVVLHSRTLCWNGIWDRFDAIQDQITHCCVFAVPLFFVISGYWFVWSFEKHGWLELLKRKLWSLYVPMVLWMVLSELIVWPTRAYVGESTPLLHYLGAPFLLFEKFSVCFHFWYVRALIVAFLLSPIIYWLTRTACRAWALFAIWTFVFLGFHVPVVHLGPYVFQHVADSGQFLLLGICLARTNFDFSRVRVPLCLLAALTIPFAWPYEGWLRLSEFVFVWSLYDVVMLLPWRGNTIGMTVPVCESIPLFFVYCVHTSVIKYLSGVGRLVLGVEPWAKMTGFCINILSFFLCIAIAFILKRYAFRVYVLLSGGR